MTRSRPSSTSVLLEVARSATRGITFQDRMKEMTEHLSRLVPCASQSALVVQLSTPKQPARELAWYGNGDVSKLIEYGRRFVHEDPMLTAAKRADGTPQLLSDFVKVGSDWFTGEYLPCPTIRFRSGSASQVDTHEGSAVAIGRLTSSRL